MSESILAMIIIILIVIGFICYYIESFIKKDNEEKIKFLKGWLKTAVREAENEIGSGNGNIKLHYVYGKMVKKLPWLIDLITFDDFSKLVDEILDWMNKEISKD